MAKDKDFEPDFAQLMDFLQVTQLDITAEDVRELAKDSLFAPNSRRAILVKDDVTFGFARVFQTHRELKGEAGIRVFRKLDDALDWLLMRKAAP